MNIQSLFDLLITERQVTVAVSDKDTVERLRIQLAKKWSTYRSSMYACGFLSKELAACSLCREQSASDSSATVFALRPRKQQKVEYTIIVTGDTNATV